MTENKEPTVETSELVELVNGEIPEGKRVVTIFEPKILMCEATGDILEQQKPDKANFYKKYKLRGQGVGEGRMQYAIQYFRLEDNSNYQERLRELLSNLMEDRKKRCEEKDKKSYNPPIGSRAENAIYCRGLDNGWTDATARAEAEIVKAFSEINLKGEQ